MIYHSSQSNDYLWYMILRGKQKKTTTRECKVLNVFFSNRQNNNFPFLNLLLREEISTVPLFNSVITKVYFRKVLAVARKTYWTLSFFREDSCKNYFLTHNDKHVLLKLKCNPLLSAKKKCQNFDLLHQFAWSLYSTTGASCNRVMKLIT